MADNSLHLHQLHAKPDGSVSNFVTTTAPQLFLSTAEGKGQQNLMLGGKPLEDLGSVVATMSGLSRPLVLISQENSDTDYSLANHNEAASPRGVATNCDHAIAHGSGIPLHSPLPEGGNRTADVITINNSSSTLPTNTAVQTHDVSTFFQQQMLLNAQLFLQQQQTVNALINKVDGLYKLVEYKGQQSIDENAEVNITRSQIIREKTHTMSGSLSDLQDFSSESENGEFDDEAEQSDNFDNERDHRETKEDKGKTEPVSENMKMLLELGKELEKSEAVGKNVHENLSKVVNTGIRTMIDRNIAKELCAKYQRPENCPALVVPKINKELWNATSLAKGSKEEVKMYQTTKRYINQGLIPLVQLTENLIEDSDTNFKLARDALQLLAYAHRDMSNLQKQRLKSVVSDKYKPLCKDSTPLTENLLGDDLEKQI